MLKIYFFEKVYQSKATTAVLATSQEEAEAALEIAEDNYMWDQVWSEDFEEEIVSSKVEEGVYEPDVHYDRLISPEGEKIPDSDQPFENPEVENPITPPENL